MKGFLLAALLFVISHGAMADIMVDINTGYNSREKNGSTSSVIEVHGFLGMPVAIKEQLYLGINATYTKTEGSEYLNTTEFGPRINYYMNADKNFLIILAYNPLVSADLHLSSGNINSGNGKISGSSYIMGLGYELKINTNFFIGTSIVYHSTTLTDDNAVSGVKELKYNSLSPMVNFCFRFK